MGNKSKRKVQNSVPPAKRESMIKCMNINIEPFAREAHSPQKSTTNHV